MTHLADAGLEPSPSSSAGPVGAGRPALLACVREQLEGLFRLGGQGPAASARVREILGLLTDESLDQPAEGPFEGLSFINADGVPFQWVARIGEGGVDWGFLCETGRPRSPGPERLALTLDRLRAASRVAGCAPPVVLETVADLFGPAPGEGWPGHWRSAIWTGVSVGGEAVRLKPYFNLNRGDARDRWLRVGWALKALGREHALEQVCRLSTSCSPGFWPVGVALDLTADGGVGRLKAYFRSQAGGPALLEPWYAACGAPGANEAVRTMLDLLGLTGSDRYPPGAFVVSLEAHADQRLSLKTDLAVTKWLDSDAQVVDGVEALSQRLGLAAGGLSTMMAGLGVTAPSRTDCEIARFVGLGCEPDGAAHLNVYLSPPRPGDASDTPRRRRSTPQRHPRQGALCRGVSALLAAQADGHWRDFSLPVGVSDRWVTAYILTRLAETDRRAGLRLAGSSAIADALAWLEASRTADGGWGYNAAVPDDADSTAWAVLALHGWSRPIPPSAISLLEGCMRQGQASTYPADNSPRAFWSGASPDVTAIAARALRVCGRRPAVGPAAAPNDLPRAFWWVTPLYVLAARAEDPQPDLSEALRARLAAFRSHGAFERALRLRLTGDAKEEAALVADQAPCGLWPASARLRLVLRAGAEPWRDIASGPVFLDEKGLFTTATAIWAMAGTAHRPASP